MSYIWLQFELDSHKILWDFSIHTYYMIEALMADHMTQEWTPKIEKNARIWQGGLKNMYVKVISVVMCGLGTRRRNLKERLAENLELRSRV